MPLSRQIPVLFFVLATFLANAQTSPLKSVLKEGDWFKMAVTKPGVYKIDYGLLKKMGLDPGKIDPHTIKIYGYGGGMVPQPNDTPRPDDLPENAIFVQGEDDGKFDNSDFILFYAEGPDDAAYDVTRAIFRYEHNLYSDKNFYFLTAGGDAGKRVSIAQDPGSDFPIVSEYNDFAYHELDDYNDQKSGREWFGEHFGISADSHTVTFPAEGIAGGPFKIVSDVMGQSYTSSSMKLSLNNVPIAQQSLLPIPNSRYGVKGIHRRDTITVGADTMGVGNSVNQSLKYDFQRGSGSSSAYLDFLLLSFTRKLALYGDQTIFTSSASLKQPVSQFRVDRATDALMVWDITDLQAIQSQSLRINGEAAYFSTATTQLKKFIAFNTSVPFPEFVAKIPNQDLHGLSTPNLVIITHPLFLSEAERLASHRMAFSNLTVAVVPIDQVYNEFSSGRQDVSAIRDFVRHLYEKSPGTLKALLLFGKGSYDYKDRIDDNTNFIPVYESRNSLSPLQTYSSDDFYCFLEPQEGYWGEDPTAPNATLDIGVGRLPAVTPEEATAMVDKIIRYDTDKKLLGYWRKQITFVADDGNSDDGFSSLHQDQANQLAEFVENDHPGIDPAKIFMGTYIKTVKPNGETVPKMMDDIVRTFERGALIINYTGHGSERQWADENIFNDQTIYALKNDRYPFLVTATCEFGRNDDPQEISSAELCVKHAGGGAIGMVTTARPVSATTNFELNEAFYDALFERDGEHYIALGEVFRRTKNNSTNGVSNRNFSLLADPSLTLALPEHQMVITSLRTASGSDTLKALSTVIAKGEIRDVSGQKLTSFTGKAEAVLFDKKTSYVTIGKNDPPLSFSQWDNALFRGQAHVDQGEFSFTFQLPKNIGYVTDKGKFSAYAYNDKNLSDAEGALMDFRIGGSEPDVVADNTPPSIRMFMGDTTFVNGGITSPNTTLVVRLKDDHGINISNYGIGNSILATLDNDADTYLLNDYFLCDTDDSQAGWIQYPLKDLSPGRHRIVLKAWDIFNNSADAFVDFTVTDGEALSIESFASYPNPFHDMTRLFFTHNRSGDDLQAQVFIHSLTGEVVKSAEITISSSDYRVDVMDIDVSGPGSKKLSPGLYLARLTVRSLTNGSKNEQVTKLIVLN